jgi:hypothetical protein
MLFFRVEWLCNGILLLMAVITAYAMYAYYVDSKRPQDDSEKKNYHFLAVILAPVTFPIFALLSFTIHLFVMLIIVPSLIASNIILSLLQKILEGILEQLKGRERLKHYFLRTGLLLFILGSLFQLMALLV